MIGDSRLFLVMKLIPLTNSAKFAMVDDEDFEDASKLKWYIYATKTVEYVFCTSTKSLHRCMHRHILRLSDKNMEVDHKDHNGLNNTKSNLCLVSHTQNQQRKRGYNKHGFKGIFLNGTRWRARIVVQGVTKNLGSYSSREEAAQAYKNAALSFFGEFAHTDMMAS